MAEHIITETLLQDNTLDEAVSGEMHGDDPDVYVAAEAGLRLRALTTFTFTQPPPGATVVSAILTRYCTERIGAATGGGIINRSLSGAPGGYTLYLESLSNWIAYDYTSPPGTAWPGSAGHNTGGTDYDTSPQQTYTWPTEEGSFQVALNTSFIDELISVEATTFTLFERATGEGASDRRIGWASKQHPSEDPPALVITYEIPVLPTVTTNEVTDIGPTYATGGGEVTDDGGATVTERGVCWATHPNPTIADAHTIDGSGEGTFESLNTSLNQDTHYYERAHATNIVGIAYGNEVEFDTTTKAGPGGGSGFGRRPTNRRATLGRASLARERRMLGYTT